MAKFGGWSDGYAAGLAAAQAAVAQQVPQQVPQQAWSPVPQQAWAPVPQQAWAPVPQHAWAGNAAPQAGPGYATHAGSFTPVIGQRPIGSIGQLMPAVVTAGFGPKAGAKVAEASPTARWFRGMMKQATTERFGFIKPDIGGPDVFVMPGQCDGFDMQLPEEGTRVAYIMDSNKPTKCGKIMAEQVSPEECMPQQPDPEPSGPAPAFNSDLFDRWGNKKPLPKMKGSLASASAAAAPLCKFFQAGMCTKGSDCHFSHDSDNAAPVKQAPPCKWFQQGTCTKGSACHFQHAGACRSSPY